MFSFGHTNVETVINRYLSQVPPQNNGIMQFIEAYRNAKVRKLNDLLTRMNDALDIERNRWNEFEPTAKDEAHFWRTCPIYGMNKIQF